MARDLIEALVSAPATIAEARRAEDKGGVPTRSGVYAWWLATVGELPEVPTSPHPSEPGLGLLYVGIAPKDSTSKETLRSRVLKKHVGSSLAGSTFRRSLAALLWAYNGWTPRLSAAGRFTFSPEDDAALRAWQERHLRVSWVEVADPWTAEPVLLRDLEPPLNLTDNREHPFFEDMSTARSLFKRAAERRSVEPD